MKYLLLIFVFMLNSYSKPIKLSSGEWFPYTTSNKSNHGLITQIIETTFKEMDQTITVNYKNFDSAYKQSLEGNYVGTFPFFKTNERLKEMIYSDPLFEVENVLFYNKNTFNKNKKIEKQRIGFIKGYAHKNIKKESFEEITIFDNEKKN